MIEKYFKENIKRARIYISGKAKGIKSYAIKLSSNENPYDACPEVYEFLRNFRNLNLYPEEEPIELIEEISKYLGVKRENILVTNGSDEGLDLIFKGFLEKNDTILIFQPTFSLYEILGEIYSTNIVKIKLIEFENEFRFPKNLYEKMNKYKPKVVFVCSPNNPTGNVIEKEKLLELLQGDTIVVMDEAYAEFSGKSFVKLVNEYENLICLRTFSKAFGLAGIRLGYIVANESVIEYLKKIKLPFNVNILAQKLGEIVLKNRKYYEKIIERIINDREYLYNRLRKFKGLKVFKSHGNFILFKSEIISGRKIYSELLKKGIIVRTCENFGLNENYIRVTIGKREEIEEFLKNLEEILCS